MIGFRKNYGKSLETMFRVYIILTYNFPKPLLIINSKTIWYLASITTKILVRTTKFKVADRHNFIDNKKCKKFLLNVNKRHTLTHDMVYRLVSCHWIHVMKNRIEKIKGYQKIQSWILHVKKYFVATNVCCNLQKSNKRHYDNS